METRELSHIKQMLEEERADIAMQLAYEQELDAENPDRSDLAQAYDIRQRREAFRQQNEEKLENIDAALLRFEEGSYGTCQECGNQIPLPRLEALPFTCYCIACKQKHDKKSGNYIPSR